MKKPTEKGDPVSYNQGKNSSSKVSEKTGPTEETPGISHHWAQGGGEAMDWQKTGASVCQGQAN